MRRSIISREARRNFRNAVKPQENDNKMRHEDVKNHMNKYDIWKIHSNTSIEYQSYFDNILYRIKRDDNFTFIRLCDGDYYNMFFRKSPDGLMDQQSINIAGDKELKILNIKYNNLLNKIDDNLIVGMQFGTQYDYEFDDVLKKYQNVCDDGYSSALFSWAYATDNIEKLFFLIDQSDRPIVIVGPKYLKNINRFKIDHHIITEEKNSWLKQDEIDNSLDNLISEWVEQSLNPIILYACSVSAKIAIVNMYDKYGDHITQLDMGSNLNPYADVPIRGWQIREKSRDKVDLFKFYEINENLGYKKQYRDFEVSSFCHGIDPIAKNYIENNIIEGDILVEIGVHGGHSLLDTFDLIENKGANLFGIDCWEDIQKIGINGLPNNFFTDDSLERFLSLHKFNRTNLEEIIERYGFGDRLKLIRGFSYDKKILSKFKKESIKYLYIDGDHSYSGCYNDLKNWYPKLMKGGILIGDDGNLPTVREALVDFCRIENIEYKYEGNKFYFIK